MKYILCFNRKDCHPRRWMNVGNQLHKTAIGKNFESSIRFIVFSAVASIALFTSTLVKPSMASILSSDYSWTDTRNGQSMQGTVWMELFEPDELPEPHKSQGYYRLRITFPPVTKKGNGGKFRIEKRTTGAANPRAGRAIFLDLSKPGLLMLAIEDDKPSFSSSHSEKIYYKEVEFEKAEKTNSGIQRYSVKRTYTGAEKLGSLHAPSTPSKEGDIEKLMKFVFEQTAGQIGLGSFIKSSKQLNEFIDDESKKNPKFWALTCSLAEKPMRVENDATYKTPSSDFSDEATLDIHRTAWDRLSGTQDEAIGYGKWGYEINYLVSIDPAKLEKSRFLMRLLLPYVRVDYQNKADVRRNRGLLELEWEIKLPLAAQAVSKRYTVSKGKATWKEAQAKCKEAGGHLVTITSQTENDNVARLLWNAGARTAWIGLSDKDLESEWKWVGGESSTFRNWAPGEPNDAGGAEDCVEIHSGSGKWNDWGLPDKEEQKSYYVCEDDNVPLSPSLSSSSVQWSGQIDSAVTVKDKTHATGKPDGKIAGLGSPNSTARFSNFTVVVDYDLNLFAKFLGVSSTLLKNADFIAFEYNGSPGTSFESSTWLFDGGERTITVHHDFKKSKTTKHLIHWGNVIPRKYAKFFNVPNRGSGCYAFLLFDLHGEIETDASKLKVTLSSRSTGPGTPDPDAVGIVRFK